MNILIVSQYFYPENFKVNDIAFDFVKKGHQVTVLTAKPNYPQGKFFKGYSFFSKRNEDIKGVKVIRIPIFPRFDGSGKYLFINYLSFIFFAFFAIKFRIKGQYDVIFSHLPSPLTSAIPGIWLKKKFKAPLILWVLDLWPENVIANSNIKNKTIIKHIKRIVNYIYKNSDKILVSSNSFKESVIKDFDLSTNKVIYFPNWAEDVFINPDFIDSDFKIPNMPNGFNIMFAGNIGESQGFESVVNAAKETKGLINWILIGDGRKADWIRMQKNIYNLTNLFILGSFPLNTMPRFFKLADVMLVSLKDESAFFGTIPAKIQAYMASGKIILGILNGEGYKLINSSGSGLAVMAGDYANLAKKAIKLKELTLQERENIQEASLQYYNDHFSKNTLFLKLEFIFKSV